MVAALIAPIFGGECASAGKRRRNKNRTAGADGPLSNPNDPNNLPANYNGAQEFYSWWKGVGTSTTPQPNGKLGRWITARQLYEQLDGGISKVAVA